MNLLLVCTGNTCRSPMAEVIARDLLKGEDGAVVRSAGVSAGPGAAATPQAVAAAGELGLDLSTHRSQPLTAQAVRAQVQAQLTRRRHGLGRGRCARPRRHTRRTHHRAVLALQ